MDELVQRAVGADEQGDVRAAIALYEEAIACGLADLDVYLNLASIYWQASDPGFSAGHALTGECINQAWERKLRLLDEAARLWPDEPETEFWRLYMGWADLNEPPEFGEECRRLLRRPSAPSVPCFYLYMQGEDYERECTALLAHCQAHPTAKNRYIASVIESVRDSQQQGL